MTSEQMRSHDAGRAGPLRARPPLHLAGRVFAVIMLLITSPLLVIAAVAIKLSSRGPVLFHARRVGYQDNEFSMLKLRTMHVRTEVGPAIAGAKDPRVFAVGKVLRRSKVDELPQLFNVVRGQMAIVGPRPEDPAIVRDFYTAAAMRTLDVLPGVASPGTLDYYAREHE